MQVYVLIGVLAYVMDRTLRVYRYRPPAFASGLEPLILYTVLQHCGVSVCGTVSGTSGLTLWMCSCA